jgi:hypothetical protein
MLDIAAQVKADQDKKEQQREMNLREADLRRGCQEKKLTSGSKVTKVVAEDGDFKLQAKYLVHQRVGVHDLRAVLEETKGGSIFSGVITMSVITASGQTVSIEGTAVDDIRIVKGMVSEKIGLPFHYQRIYLAQVESDESARLAEVETGEKTDLLLEQLRSGSIAFKEYKKQLAELELDEQLKDGMTLQQVLVRARCDLTASTAALELQVVIDDTEIDWTKFVRFKKTAFSMIPDPYMRWSKRGGDFFKALELNFPPPKGININMMPFIIGDMASVPREVGVSTTGVSAVPPCTTPSPLSLPSRSPLTLCFSFALSSSTSLVP